MPSQEDTTHVIKMMRETMLAIRDAQLSKVWDALDRLDGKELGEMNEALRLVRGFIRNV